MAKKRSPKKKVSPHSSTSPDAQRLNKILAAAGLGSRRKVEDLIEQGRVEINGDIVTDLSCKVEPDQVKIKVDGQMLKQSRPVYYALNKPPGVLSTNYDPSGRMRVIDLVPDRDRVFSVGRLDQSSEGLMLLTNDGDLAQRLAHPRFHIQKTYFVVVAGQMTEDELNKLRKGVYLAEGMARIDGASIKRVRKGCTEIEIVLSEGKNREIRRILARAGHKVVLLRRIAIGTLRLGQMPVGASRTLTASEVKALYAASDPTQRTAGKTAKGVWAKNKSTAVSTSTTAGKSTAQKKVASRPTEHSAEYSPGYSAAYDDDDGDDLLSLALNDPQQDVDDDFVGDFSGTGGSGSVLAFEDEAPKQPRGPRASRPRREPPIRSAAAARKEARAEGEQSSQAAQTSRPKAYRNSKSQASEGPKAKDGGPRASRVKPSSTTRKSSASPGRGASQSEGKSAGRSAGKPASKPASKGTSAGGRSSSRTGGSAKSPVRGKKSSNARGKR